MVHHLAAKNKICEFDSSTSIPILRTSSSPSSSIFKSPYQNLVIYLLPHTYHMLLLSPPITLDLITLKTFDAYHSGIAV
jgi:hypothetical protein